MAQYRVQVWITEVDVEADSINEAEEKAMELIDSELSCAAAEYAEAQSVFEDGERRLILIGEQRR